MVLNLVAIQQGDAADPATAGCALSTVHLAGPPILGVGHQGIVPHYCR
jgi:hypothetical protein